MGIRKKKALEAGLWLSLPLIAALAGGCSLLVMGGPERDAGSESFDCPVDCSSRDSECVLWHCDRGRGVCVAATQEGEGCDDGSPCTQNDVCRASGLCFGEIAEPLPPQCVGDCILSTCVTTWEPGNCAAFPRCQGTMCTLDDNAPENLPCDDGDVCTGGDRCDGAGLCVGDRTAACRDAGPPDIDAGRFDAGPEPRRDAGMDAGTDAGSFPEAGMDSGPPEDAGGPEDAGQDAGQDAGDGCGEDCSTYNNECERYSCVFGSCEPTLFLCDAEAGPVGMPDGGPPMLEAGVSAWF